MTGPTRRAMLGALGSTTLLAGASASAREGRRIQVGQIGVAHGHASKLAVFRASADYEVVGVVEPDSALRAQAESQPAFRGVRWLTREQLLDVPGLDVVLVETRVRDLLPTAEACLAAGKHVHLDKPPGASLPRFRALLELAASKKRIVQLGYMYRYNPGIVLLRELLTQGWLGEVFEVHAVMSKVVAASERAKLAEFRGGMMFELGCHLIDLVVGILGKPELVTYYSQHVGAQDDGLADNMLAVLGYPRALATVKSSGVEVEGFARRHLVVCGTEGTVHIEPLDDPKARLALARPRGKYQQGYQEITLPRYERYITDAADMARIVRGEKASDFTMAHDLAVQETVLRAAGMPLDV